MFFKQIYRNASKNRKSNSLFFGSLAIAVVAFYTLLSLGELDVMRFLAAIESDAVNKLMKLLPLIYIVSLFFVFFLVYFSCKYQTDSRGKEFGLYLMMGMKRTRMFFMLFCETLVSSLVSVLVGLPIALMLTEGISLGTAKLVGIGIIGHHFSFSGKAVLWTVCGFILVQLLSMLIICIPLTKTQPADFLHGNRTEKQEKLSKSKSSAFFVLGALLLIFSYYLGIFRLNRLDYHVVLLIFCGITGTFFLYRGLGGFIGNRILRNAPNATGLATFTGRQIQENVICQYKALAVSSLLLLMALSCVSYGISLVFNRASESRSTDFSLFGSDAEIQKVLEQENIKSMTKTAYPVYLSMIKDTLWDEIDPSGINAALQTIEGGESVSRYMHWEYMIAQSGYNQLLEAIGKEPLHLRENEVALFSSMGKGEDGGNFYRILDEATKKNASIRIGGKEFSFVHGLYYDNIVADRAITLYNAMIVPDSLFFELAGEPEVYCYNLHLKEEETQKSGLMQAIQKMDGYLSESELRYESYLRGIGRNLFYTVAASYLTIYLGILFLLIANTVIGLKYLMSHRQSKHRYQTLVMLGAEIETLGKSVQKQIFQFFFLVLSVSAVNSIVAIVSMFTGLTRLPIGTSVGKILILAGVVLVVFMIIEILYITAVRRTACRDICRMGEEDSRERVF